MEQRRPLMQLAVGVGSAFALMATLIAPLWMIELLLIAMSIWLVTWMVRAPFTRLASPRRLPRLIVFGPLGIGVAANLYLVNVTGRGALVVNLIALTAAFVVGSYRIAKAPAGPAGTSLR